MGTNGIQSFRDLDTWKVSMNLTVLAYALAKRLPATERFELAAQIRRAAVSIPANVAEGQGCGRDGRYIFHVRIALGSLGELVTHFELTRRLQFLAEADLTEVEEQLARTGQLLHGLLRSLQRKRLARVPLALLAGFALWLGLLASRG